MSRPTRIQTFMEIAHAWSKRSTCQRLNVGAVIVKDRTVIAHGYNGLPPGEPHCAGNDCPGMVPGKCRTLHAEENAIKRMADRIVNAWDIYCTDSPCDLCASLIYAYGGSRVFFATPYRVTKSLDWLIDHGVGVYRVTPAGYVMEWRTRELRDFDV